MSIFQNHVESQRRVGLDQPWSIALGQPAFWFGIYVFWLTSFPMSGSLLYGAAMIWFILPHAVALLALGRWLTAHSLVQILPVSTMGTALLTAFFAFSANDLRVPHMEVALVLLGLTAAPLSIHLGRLLGSARWPIGAAAIGLGLGNLCSAAFELMPGSNTIKLIILACLIPGILWARIGPAQSDPPNAQSTDSDASPLWRLLPFIALFQMVSGLLYGHLWPAYRGQMVWPGTELLFYVLAVIVTARYGVRHRSGCVLIAVGLATLSFAAQHANTGLVGHHLSLFLMMASVGVVDLVLLATVLAQANLIRAYGYAVGVMVAGIVAGDFLAKSLSGSDVSIALLALALLNLGTVALFVQKDRLLRDPTRLAANSDATANEAPPATDDELPSEFVESVPTIAAIAPLPARIADQLSHQEVRVLQATIGQRTYRDIAQAFGISESSVKTYMQRSYRKLGIYSRRQLEQLLKSEYEAESAHSHGVSKDSNSNRISPSMPPEIGQQKALSLTVTNLSPQEFAPPSQQ